MKQFNIACVPLHLVESKEEIKHLISSLLDQHRSRISFINPEIILHQEKKKELNTYFNQTAYNFIDGIGLLYAINKKYKTKYNSHFRFPGTDFFNYLPNRNIRVYLFGGSAINVKMAKSKIEEKFRNISIVGCSDGFSYLSDSEIVSKINAAQTDILIVCLGCPIQETWISRNLNDLDVKICLGNGGAIDFWSGSIKRAPPYIIEFGFEFIYRLFQNFTIKRIKRQLRLINFILKYII